MSMQLLFSQENLQDTNSYTNYVFIIIKVLNGEMRAHAETQSISGKYYKCKKLGLPRNTNALGMEANSHILF